MGQNESSAKKKTHSSERASKKKLERAYTSSLTAHLKALEQKEANTLKRSRWQEVIQLRAETNFPNRIPMAYALRSRIDKYDLIKLQSFCKAKDTVNRTKLSIGTNRLGKDLHQSYI